MVNKNKLIKELKQNEEDFEFYPTPESIAEIVSKKISDKANSFLDIGTGDGEYFNKYLYENTYVALKYGIEKSTILARKALSNDFLIMGNDFHQMDLASFDVDVIYCNPPYLQYEDWVSRIIRESLTYDIYFLIPKRWENSDKINSALADLDLTANEIADYDFNQSEDREARAKTVLIHIKKYDIYDNQDTKVATSYGITDKEEVDEDIENLVDENKSVVHSNRGIVLEELVREYEAKKLELSKGIDFIKNNGSTIRLFNLTPTQAFNTLYSNLKNLRLKYFEYVFKSCKDFTRLMTYKKKSQMMQEIRIHKNIDFNMDSITNMLLNLVHDVANSVDSNVVSIFDRFSSPGNISQYKSNFRLKDIENFRSFRGQLENSNIIYKLDYRIVLDNAYDVDGASYLGDGYYDNILEDFVKVINMMGYASKLFHEVHNLYTVERGSKHNFYLDNGEIAFEFKLFKNGNIHLKVEQEIMKDICLKVALDRKWIKDFSEAEQYIGVTEEAYDRVSSIATNNRLIGSINNLRLN